MAEWRGRVATGAAPGSRMAPPGLGRQGGVCGVQRGQMVSSGRPAPIDRMASRGQSVSIDFMVAAFIFLFILGYYMLTWSDFSMRFAENAAGSRMELRAISAADMLVSSGGVPFNWTGQPKNALSVGFARRRGELDMGRISALGAMDYADAKEALGVDSEFLVKVEDAAGNRYGIAGIENATVSNSVEVSRIATLDGKTVFVKVRLYDN